MRARSGPALDEIRKAARALRDAFVALNVPAGEEPTTLGVFTTMTPEAEWLNKQVSRNRLLKANIEWLLALLELERAIDLGSSSPPKEGIVRDFFNGKYLRISDGALIDPRGRKEEWPVLRRLIYKLMDETDGELTFDKNYVSGSLVTALNELRQDIPEIIPAEAELPASTIATIVSDWKKQRQHHEKLKARARGLDKKSAD